MTILTRVNRIETQMGIGNEPLNEEDCKLFGLELGSTQADAKAVYEKVCATPQSHPKYRIIERMKKNNKS